MLAFVRQRSGGGSMTVWQGVTEGLGHGGYVAWESAIAAAMGQPGQDHLQVFAALQPVDGMTLADVIDASLNLPGVHYSRHERDLLATERALAGGGWPHEVRLVAFCPRSMLDQLPAFWRVIEVGPPVVLPRLDDPTPGEDLCATQGDLDPRVPVAAVIDDGIGFLNARFRSDPRLTAVMRAVWLQASNALVAGDIVCGQVLTGPEIDAHLATGAAEAEVYAQVNRALYPVMDGALTNRRVAHGTHVLDLAAGASPIGRDPLREVPILAVQLPPQSVRETAGRRLETYLVQGLRWLLAEVLRQAQGTDVPPLVVNISLGSLAGSWRQSRLPLPTG
jgi:hypothetical protein